jgi:hypothetical protein
MDLIFVSHSNKHPVMMVVARRVQQVTGHENGKIFLRKSILLWLLYCHVLADWDSLHGRLGLGLATAHLSP